MKHKLSPLARTITLVASCAMLLVLSLPIWRIELTAPQYPEGLVLKIYANKIGGDVDVVNGLNHYIGMHTLHTRDFVEFTVLPFIIGAFALLGLITTLVNRRSLFYAWTGLFLLIAITSMIDFYRWEYNYGHNLDPAAPIQVPGMAYQPPLLGYKQLLNFGAFSIPDSGGWIFAGVGVALAITVLIDIRSQRHKVPRAASLPPAARMMIITVITTAITLTGCNNKPQPIQYGQDNCDFCKMTIVDRHYGAEVITKKGKLFKYDDVHCLTSSLKMNIPDKKDIAGIYFVDYDGGPWLSAEKSYLLRSDSLRSPMNGNIGAFASPSARDQYQQKLTGLPLTWKEISPY